MTRGLGITSTSISASILRRSSRMGYVRIVPIPTMTTWWAGLRAARHQHPKGRSLPRKAPPCHGDGSWTSVIPNAGTLTYCRTNPCPTFPLAVWNIPLLIVVSCLPEHLKDVARFACYSAWRKNEITLLLWRDLEDGVMRLRLEASKNAEARVLMLTGVIADIIDRRREQGKTSFPMCSIAMESRLGDLTKHGIGLVERPVCLENSSTISGEQPCGTWCGRVFPNVAPCRSAAIRREVSLTAITSSMRRT